MKTVGVYLGTNRSLTAISSAMLALHPNVTVLNHGFARILADRTNDFILYPSHESWLPCLDLAKSSSTQRSRRVAFQLDRKSFEALRSEQQLPPGIRVAPMDAAMMRKVEATVYPWIGGTWKSPADFEKRGVGVCASTEDEVASLCYSVFVSHGSYAIDIVTVEKFKRLGLARAVASAFIVECVCRGFHPTWDCYESNFASMRLADALGFKPAREFFVYSWHRQSR
ncbi:MAG: GNAT family N-acetyltransferase [Alcaligenaceae bacterium]|nr:MAG: GNAT family N-acetyltransferase [Alcaligenaceae bacterium]